MKSLYTSLLLALAVISLNSCNAKRIVVPEATILIAKDCVPPRDLFGDDCEFSPGMMDDISTSIVDGDKEFKFDEYPYTLVIPTENPCFNLQVCYWENCQNAFAGLQSAHSNSDDSLYVDAEPIVQDGEVCSFVARSRNGLFFYIVQYRNVSFRVADMYQEVKDEQKIKQYAQKYLDFLKSKAKE
jgi:hypothetical protein